MLNVVALIIIIIGAGEALGGDGYVYRLLHICPIYVHFKYSL